MTPEAVLALARELIQPANVSLVVLGPSKRQRRVAKAWLDAWQPGATSALGVE